MEAVMFTNLNKYSKYQNSKWFIIAILLCSILSIVYLQLRHPADNSSVEPTFDYSTIIDHFNGKLNQGTFLFSEPVTWNGQFIPVESYAGINLKSLSSEYADGLVLYWLHRIKFASTEETSVIKDSFEAVKSLPYDINEANLEFLDCSLTEKCDYKKLINNFSNSAWVPFWAMKADIEYVKSKSDELNELNISAVSDLDFFELRNNAGHVEIIPPALADYLITIPFYLNCETNNQKLLMYLYEVKTRFPQLSTIVDEFMSMASKSQCEG